MMTPEPAVKSLVLVALGGGAGSMLRYLVGLLWLRVPTTPLAWGTLTVNVTGSLALGFLARLFAPPHGSPALFLFLTVGLCGGYTTFSTFTLDLFVFAERGAWGRAVLYALVSVVISYGALVAGMLAARAVRPV
jgi:CrcB protein